ncbi:hypothetical protein BOTBODRAFT_58563 [Botryobasidium botryosum FD-172 SS1]|uniref:F-box domain-containing protein n=1 Tax=Botryobasidium botryosum (strain FD-172 SS1) TaxID=930990 RepID=A0A067MDJ8_BOTB1|nr:hypothetical protein BOTBODRAFT_58563 [Botryobasidium botryosum FD-172 SS1]
MGYDTVHTAHDRSTSRSPYLHLSPISNLPIEILVLISRYAERGTPAPLVGSTLNSLSRVSRSWRAIALGTPGLWTAICDISVPYVDTLLGRSGNRPLRIVRMMEHGLRFPEYMSLVSPHIQTLG